MEPSRARSPWTTRSFIAISFFALGAVSSVALSKRGSMHNPPVTVSCAREHEEIEALSAEVRQLSTSLARSELGKAPRPARRGRSDVALSAVPNTAMGSPEETTTPMAAPTPAAENNHAPSKGTDDRGLARIDEVQAHEPADVQWAAETESRLRQLGAQLSSAATIEQIKCTSTLCKVELAHGSGDIPPARLGAFMTGAQELLPQVTVYPDHANHKTTLVFGRAGSNSPEASGGAS